MLKSTIKIDLYLYDIEHNMHRRKYEGGLWGLSPPNSKVST